MKSVGYARLELVCISQTKSGYQHIDQPLAAAGCVLTQMPRQMQERYEVARVKTDSQFGRTLIIPKDYERFEEQCHSTEGRYIR